MNTYRIEDCDFWYRIEKDFPVEGGTYELFCIDSENNVLPVDRFLGNDTNGILYIGKTINFLDRVITLKKSISAKYKSSGHECGTRYKSLIKISDLFPYENLFVKLTPSDRVDQLEKEKLENYFRLFGELPPLNRMG